MRHKFFDFIRMSFESMCRSVRCFTSIVFKLLFSLDSTLVRFFFYFVVPLLWLIFIGISIKLKEISSIFFLFFFVFVSSQFVSLISSVDEMTHAKRVKYKDNNQLKLAMNSIAIICILPLHSLYYKYIFNLR